VSRTPPLKILHVLDHSLPLHSGYAFRTQSILRAQIERGWQPVGLTAPVAGRRPARDRGLAETIDGCRYYRTAPVLAGLSFVDTHGRRMMALGRRLREVVAIERPDLLHVHSPALNSLPALRLGRVTGNPLVYEMRTLWEDAAAAHGAYARGSWKYRLMRGLETRACRKAREVAVLCEGLRQDLVERGIPPAKLTVAANGVDVERFQPRAPDPEYARAWIPGGKRVVGYVGSFSAYEGLDVLLEAVARLAARGSDVVLLLVGGGKAAPDLAAHVRRLGLEGRVVMPGRIAHDRIPGVYPLAEVLAYPRRALRLTELVTPLKPLEAMAMARAVVASDVGGHRELVEHGRTGLLFPAGDAAALAEALGRLLDDHALRRALEREGSAWVRRTRSWDRTTAAYGDVYARALGRPAAGLL
jgi:PEP-CTERM/exosortase A-associated glycosyltransferase